MTEASGVRTPETTQTPETVDAVVIGAGFCGLYATYRLSRMGLDVRAFDAGDDVGGVWYWNRYPGAQTDSPQHTYQFTFDEELLKEKHYSRKFPGQKEVLGYLNHFADRFDLRPHYTFGSKVVSVIFDDESGLWETTNETGVTVRSTYVVTGMGLVSEPILPNYPGIDTFEGEIVFTTRWPHEDVQLEGKRIALIGTGSSGIQITSTLADAAAQLTVYQRTPNYVVPTGNHEITEADRADILGRYAAIQSQIRNHPAAFPFNPSQGRTAVSATEAERDAIFEEMWVRGGFSFLYESFDDLAINDEANEYACEFIRSKIRSIVKDPVTADRLSPTYAYGAKRPPTGDTFYQAFNKETVDLVSLRETPIEEFTATGIRTMEGTREFDLIVFATGFDASTGAFTRTDIRGRDGRELTEHWAAGPSTYLGIGVHGFPNFFMVAGPQSPFSNLPPGAELEGGWIMDILEYMKANGHRFAEPTAEAELEWNAHVKAVADGSLMVHGAEVNSWFTGANIEGKPVAYNVYFGGANAYADLLEKEAESSYSSFTFGDSPAALERSEAARAS